MVSSEKSIIGDEISDWTDELSLFTILKSDLSQENYNEMDRLLDGVRRFRRDIFGQKRALFAQLAEGQAPRILFITCSDSRIDPHLVTSSEPGDLFVLRNAGNLVPAYGSAASGTEGTIEYAVAVLKVEHIVVCGHSGCEAMNGLLHPNSLAAMPSVTRWLEHARATLQVVDATYGTRLSPAERLARTVEINTLRQLDNLRTHPSVAAALARDALSLHTWIYNIETGAVKAYDQRRRRFTDLNHELSRQMDDYRSLAAAG